MKISLLVLVALLLTIKCTIALLPLEPMNFAQFSHAINIDDIKAIEYYLQNHRLTDDELEEASESCISYSCVWHAFHSAALITLLKHCNRTDLATIASKPLYHAVSSKIVTAVNLLRLYNADPYKMDVSPFHLDRRAPATAAALNASLLKKLENNRLRATFHQDTFYQSIIDDSEQTITERRVIQDLLTGEPSSWPIDYLRTKNEIKIRPIDVSQAISLGDNAAIASFLQSMEKKSDAHVCANKIDDLLNQAFRHRFLNYEALHFLIRDKRRLTCKIFKESHKDQEAEDFNQSELYLSFMDCVQQIHVQGVFYLLVHQGVMPERALQFRNKIHEPKTFSQIVNEQTKPSWLTSSEFNARQNSIMRMVLDPDKCIRSCLSYCPDTQLAEQHSGSKKRKRSFRMAYE